MSGRTRSGLISFLVVAVALALACGGGETVEPRPPTPTVMPTAAGGTPSATQPTATRAPASTPPPASVPAGDVAKGKTLFTNNGCSGCHSTAGEKIVGPGLGGLKGRAGSVVAGLSADAYIEQSIRQPNAHVVAGYPPNVMPAFANLSAQEMADLLAYLKTL